MQQGICLGPAACGQKAATHIAATDVLAARQLAQSLQPQQPVEHQQKEVAGSVVAQQPQQRGGASTQHGPQQPQQQEVAGSSAQQHQQQVAAGAAESHPIPAQNELRHRVGQVGRYMCCVRCGAYAKHVCRGLAEPCLGPPLSNSSKDKCRRLKRSRLLPGLDPVTGRALELVPGEVVRRGGWQSLAG